MPTDTTHARLISAAADHMLAITGTIADRELERPTPCHDTDLAAWEGMTQAGGVDLPAEVMGMVALSELVLHGWDVAHAADIAFDIPDEILQVVFDFHYPPQPQDEREGMFGPVVEVPGDAPLVDRLAGLTGRDPRWPNSTPED